jgi:hypothetical protein
MIDSFYSKLRLAALQRGEACLTAPLVSQTRRHSRRNKVRLLLMAIGRVIKRMLEPNDLWR